MLTFCGYFQTNSNCYALQSTHRECKHVLNSLLLCHGKHSLSVQILDQSVGGKLTNEIKTALERRRHFKDMKPCITYSLMFLSIIS